MAKKPKKVIAYWYVKESNRAWVDRTARKSGLSRSATVDLMLDKLRERVSSRRIARVA